jgi:hypothetical protein
MCCVLWVKICWDYHEYFGILFFLNLSPLFLFLLCSFGLGYVFVYLYLLGLFFFLGARWVDSRAFLGWVDTSGFFCMG